MTVVLEKQDNEAYGFEVQVRSLPHFSFSQFWWVKVSVQLFILFLNKVEVHIWWYWSIHRIAHWAFCMICKLAVREQSHNIIWIFLEHIIYVFLSSTFQTYGIQLNNSNELEMCTFVCSVQEGSSAETAGLTAGETHPHPHTHSYICTHTYIAWELQLLPLHSLPHDHTYMTWPLHCCSFTQVLCLLCPPRLISTPPHTLLAVFFFPMILSM